MEVYFHIPDFTRHYKLNMLLIKAMKAYPEYFRDGIKIGSVYGEFPTALWNGGRNFAGNCDKDFIKGVLKNFNDLGIPCRFTYSNPLIEKQHLTDKFCNMCMSIADNGLNEVIVVSPVLEKYIRNNYPNYKITSSTCKTIRNLDDLNSELEKDYHLVVLDYNWNNNFEVLESIKHKEKCELLINACCAPDCKRRSEHYRHIGQRQIDYCESLKTGRKLPPDDFVCEHMNKNLYETIGYSTHITPNDIFEKYAPMGFKHFKIEGRAFHYLNLLETYMYYMAKPEKRDELRLNMLLQLHKENGYLT